MTGSKLGLQKIAFNALSVLGGDVLNKAGIFLAYGILSRTAGVTEFGQLSLGLMLLYTFHVFAVAGLPVALTRKVAKRPTAAKRLLQHGYLAAMLPALLSTLAMIGLSLVMQYERQTVLIITLLALAVPPYALTIITESVIKGRAQMHLIALGNVPGNAFLVLGSFAAMTAGYGVTAVAGVIVGSRVLSLFAMHTLFRLDAIECPPGHLRPRISWLLLRKSMVFLGTEGVHAIGVSISGLLLSKFASERELGLLGASYQLLQPINMLYRSVGHSCFPPLVAAARVSGAAVGRLARTILGLIVRMAVPATLVVFCLAGDLLSTVYGNNEFRDGAIVLQILALTILLDPLNPILGHALWAMNQDRTVLRIVIGNLIANAVGGFVLISQFGLLGAGYTSLLSSFVNMSQHYWHFDRKVDRLHLGGEIVKFAPATLAAIAILVLSPMNRYASLSAALVIYASLAFLPFNQFALRGQISGESGS